MIEVYKERKALVLSWEQGEYKGPVTLRAESGDDVSTTDLVSNPGFAAVSFPLEHTGTFNAQVLDDDGNVIDEGEISVS